jgi:hypothetical protein
MAGMSKATLDDENGNCKQCGHPFDPHLVIAYDRDDLSKGGEIRCNVSGCECLHPMDFKLLPAINVG